MKKYFYVYYSYEEYGRGYIGKRECKCLPEEDIKYFGSYTDKTFTPTQKIIIETFNTAEEAYFAEKILQEFYQVDKNPHFANIYIHRSEKFCNNGNEIVRKKISSALTVIKRSEETKLKISQAKKGTIVKEETKNIISEKTKERIPPNKGKKHSEETKRKISEARKMQCELKKNQKQGRGN